jgi:hypothetical protein
VDGFWSVAIDRKLGSIEVLSFGVGSLSVVL